MKGETYRILGEGDCFQGGDEWELFPGVWVQTSLRGFRLAQCDLGRYRRRIEQPDQRLRVPAVVLNHGRVS